MAGVLQRSDNRYKRGTMQQPLQDVVIKTGVTLIVQPSSFNSARWDRQRLCKGFEDGCAVLTKSHERLQQLLPEVQGHAEERLWVTIKALIVYWKQ